MQIAILDSENYIVNVQVFGDMETVKKVLPGKKTKRIDTLDPKPWIGWRLVGSTFQPPGKTEEE